MSDSPGKMLSGALKILALVCSVFAALVLFVGMIAFLMGIFCFLGGIEGGSGSQPGTHYSFICFLIAALCGGLFYLMFAFKRMARQILLGTCEILFVLSAIILLFAAIFRAREPGMPEAVFFPLIFFAGLSYAGAKLLIYEAQKEDRKKAEKKRPKETRQNRSNRHARNAPRRDAWNRAVAMSGSAGRGSCDSDKVKKL